jgi:hypothetical protein
MPQRRRPQREAASARLLPPLLCTRTGPPALPLASLILALFLCFACAPAAVLDVATPLSFSEIDLVCLALLLSLTVSGQIQLGYFSLHILD